MNGATIDGLLTTKARIYKLNCIGTKVKVGMDFRDCHFGTGNHREGDKVSFDRTTFEESSFLGLSGSSIDGDLTITGNLTPPRSINIDGCTIKKDTVIRSEVGRPSIKLVAPQKRPDFHGKVLVENVSLAECRLLGNPINRMEMRNVEWKQENNRAVLYDEIVLRKISTELTPTATKALKEAYQILKEQYRTLGDHVTSGDFHYGEMEMKRREYSWVGRHFGLTGLYYALSGYGTHPWRAFRFLCYFLVLVTGLFALGQDGTLTDIVLKSAELTLQAASLQPLTATQFERVSPYVRAVFQIARIVIPLQAALLALAIRMRLKR